jgi:hypothetical protein
MAEVSKSSTNYAAGAWVARIWARWMMPSAADLIFVAILGVLLLTPLSVKLLGDAGIGWHIRTGQQILATHAIPRVDSFSVTTQGRPWYAWEWLYDVVVGWLESTVGFNGVVWFTAVVIAATFAWLFRLLVARGTDFFAALGLTLVAASAAMIHFLARPHVVSWLLTLAWFWILESTDRDGQRRSPQDPHSTHSLRSLAQGRLSLRLKNGSAQDDAQSSGHHNWITNPLWALPVLMVLWVHVHGGFLVGFVLLGIFWVGSVWEWWTAKEARIEEVLQKLAAARRIKDLTLVGVVCGLASLVNPYGWRLHEHIYRYLTNRFLMDHIEEFQSPNFHGIAQKCFGILILLVIAALAWKIPTQRKPRCVGHPREFNLSEVLTVLFAVYAGLYASRNIPVSAILLAMVVGPRLREIPFVRGFSHRMAAVETGMRGHVWAVSTVVITFLIALNGGRVGSSQLMDAHFDPARMPVGAVDYLEKQKLTGPVFSPDYWGGYLIYRFYPDTRVVVDDRHDLYGDEFFKSYLKMWRVEEGWKEFLDEHPVQSLVLPRNAALANALIGDSRWKEVYRDEMAVVFENESTVNQ